MVTKKLLCTVALRNSWNIQYYQSSDKLFRASWKIHSPPVNNCCVAYPRAQIGHAICTFAGPQIFSWIQNNQALSLKHFLTIKEEGMEDLSQESPFLYIVFHPRLLIEVSCKTSSFTRKLTQVPYWNPLLPCTKDWALHFLCLIKIF